MSIQLVYNWRHRLFGWKRQKIESEREKSSVPLLFSFVSLSVPHRYDCDAIPTGVTAKE